MASRQPLCENYLLPRLDRSSLSRITYTLLKYNTQIERYYRSSRNEFLPSFFFPFFILFSFFFSPPPPPFPLLPNDQPPFNFHNCSDKMITRSVWIPSLSANSSALFEDSPSFKGFLVGPCSHPSASARSSSGSSDPFPSSSPLFVPPNADTATVVVDVVTVLAIALFEGTLGLPSNSEYAVPPRTSNGKSQRVSLSYLADARRSFLP